MNPAFILLVVIGAFLLWLLLSFTFIPIGKLVNKLLKDSFRAMHGGGKTDFNEQEEDNEDGI